MDWSNLIRCAGSSDSSREEEEHLRRAYEMDENDDEVIALLQHKKNRNTGKQPGGSNAHGRAKYWDSV